MRGEGREKGEGALERTERKRIEQKKRRRGEKKRLLLGRDRQGMQSCEVMEHKASCRLPFGMEESWLICDDDSSSELECE